MQRVLMGQSRIDLTPDDFLVLLASWWFKPFFESSVALQGVDLVADETVLHRPA
jgi:hypothetical protein